MLFWKRMWTHPSPMLFWRRMWTHASPTITLYLLDASKVILRMDVKSWPCFCQKYCKCKLQYSWPIIKGIALVRLFGQHHWNAFFANANDEPILALNACLQMCSQGISNCGSNWNSLPGPTEALKPKCSLCFSPVKYKHGYINGVACLVPTHTANKGIILLRRNSRHDVCAFCLGLFDLLQINLFPSNQRILMCFTWFQLEACL